MHLGHSTYCCVARGGASRPRSGMRPRHHLAINGILTSRSHILWAILQQGVRFDPDMPQTIRLEFAKSNTKVSKPKQQAANAANTHPTLMHPLTGLYFSDLGTPFFPGGPELWHHPLAYSAAAELPGAALQHATLVHPALHPQVPVRSYL
jgi:hypothetical protein